MRRLLLLLFLMSVAGVASGANFSNHATPPDKATYVGDNMADGREGGESWGDALVISELPYSDSGATCDNLDDITLPCAASAAPDVVYRYTATSTTSINVSLCGSGYDTALAIYDSAQNNLYCNDDFCGLQSEIDNIPITAGETYYIVVDGFSTNCGSYTITVGGIVPCIVECPAGSQIESEPPCGDNYYDTYNGGCNTQGFQVINANPDNTAVLCGKSGNYSYYGSTYRDTDWFTVTAAGGDLTATVNAEFAVQMFFFYVIDYNCTNYQYNSASGPCGQDLSLSYNLSNGAEAWVCVAPSVFVGVPCESDYLLTLTGVSGGITPTQATSWGQIKTFFRQ